MDKKEGQDGTGSVMEKGGGHIESPIHLDIARTLETEVSRKIYDDLLHPILVEAGQGGAEAIAFVRAVLKGTIQEVIDSPRKFGMMLKRIQARVKEWREPRAEFVGPCLESMKYLPEGHPLFEMFEELLAKACDRTVDDVHPAFPNVIRQLCPDEAKLLTWIRTPVPGVVHALSYYIEGFDRDNVAHLSPSGRHHAQGLLRTTPGVESRFRFDELSVPYRGTMYTEHLEALNLIEISSEATTNTALGQEHVHLTSFGNLFCEACVPMRFSAFSDAETAGRELTAEQAERFRGTPDS